MVQQCIVCGARLAGEDELLRHLQHAHPTDPEGPPAPFVPAS